MSAWLLLTPTIERGPQSCVWCGMLWCVVVCCVVVWCGVIWFGFLSFFSRQRFAMEPLLVSNTVSQVLILQTGTTVPGWNKDTNDPSKARRVVRVYEVALLGELLVTFLQSQGLRISRNSDGKRGTTITSGKSCPIPILPGVLSD